MKHMVKQEKTEEQKKQEAFGLEKADTNSLEHEASGEQSQAPVVEKDDGEPAKLEPKVDIYSQKSPKQLARDELARKQEERKAAERGETADADDTADASAAAYDDGTAAKPANKGKGYEIRQNDEGEDCLVLKINGQEVLRPITKTIEREQKGIAGEDKFREAQRILNEANELATVTKEREAQINAQADELRKKATTGPLSTEDEASLDKAMEEVTEALFQGDTAKATAAFKKAVQAGRGDSPTQSMTADEIKKVVNQTIVERSATATQQQLEQQAIEKHNADLTEAKDKFLIAFPDIPKGSERWNVVNKLIPDVFADPAFKDKPYADVFIEAGKRARKTFQPTTDKLTKKLDAKQHVSQRTGVEQVAKADETQPKSMLQKVQDMKSRRRPHLQY